MQPLATTPEAKLGDFNEPKKKEQMGQKERCQMKELEISRMPQLPFEVTEALNQLRINLAFCGDQIKTIMVTSSVLNEGKSFIAMQL